MVYGNMSFNGNNGWRLNQFLSQIRSVEKGTPVTVMLKDFPFYCLKQGLLRLTNLQIEAIRVTMFFQLFITTMSLVPTKRSQS